MISVMTDPLLNSSSRISRLLICTNLSWGTLLAAGVTVFAQITHGAAEALIFSLTILGNTGYVC